MPARSWTDEKYTELAKLWADNPGQSLSDLGCHFGVSRSSVSGAVMRARALGFELAARVGPTFRQRNKPEKSAMPKPSREGRRRIGTTLKGPTPLPVHEPLAAHAIGTFSLTERTCKWPYGDGPNWTHCGTPKGSDGPYCAFHAAKAFNKQPATPEARAKSREAARVLARVGM